MICAVPLHRRALLGAGLAATAATLTGCAGRAAGATWAAPPRGPTRPHAVPASSGPPVRLVPRYDRPVREVLHR